MATKKSAAKAKTGGIKVGVDKDSSIGVRQIENGFIVSESGTTGKGRNKTWYNKEYFSKNNPVKLGGSGSAQSSGSFRMGGKKK